MAICARLRALAGGGQDVRTADRVVLSWCDAGEVSGEFAVSVARLVGLRGARLEGVMRREGSGLLSKIRNEIVASFLDETRAAWLLMVDADHHLPPQAFDLLVAAAHDTAAPVIGGLYFGAFTTADQLYPAPMPVMFKAADDDFYTAIHEYPDNALIPVDAAGTGCLLVHRSVLERIRDQASPDEGRNYCWFSDGPVQGTWRGEDISFCRRIRALGVPIHVHTGAVLPHLKRYWLTADHHRAWWASLPD